MDRGGITLNWTALGVIFAVLVAAVGAVYNIASKDAADDRQDREIAALQADTRAMATNVAAIKSSTERIETTLDILLPPPTRRQGVTQ